ncbi:MAG: CapA family protein [Anaerolineae bacterium]|nr:CapA family protein [Anaerolineae bacterium]MDW8171525.1 CapA family protein [Anaerolineae bacterium]
MRLFSVTVWLLLLVSFVRFPAINAQQACLDASGQLQRHNYYSARLRQTMFYSVYLPPCYDPNRTYPSLFLLHGSNEDDGHWLRLGLPAVLDDGIRAEDWPALIAVLPFGDVIANRNRFDSASWANIFLEELLPDVEARYNLSSDPRLRALGGISRGGFWAYQIGLRRPDLFGVLGGHSAFFDERHAPPADNPLDIALASQTITRQRLWLDSGGQDYAKPNVELMVARLTQRGVPFTYQAYADGQHTNSHWRRYVADYVRWYTLGWNEATMPSPTPGAPILANPFATNTPLAPTNPAQAQVRPVHALAINQVDGLILLPVAAFPSMQTTISRATLEGLRAGQTSPRLIVDEITEAQLVAQGIRLPPEARRVNSESLVSALWGDRDAFALLSLERLSLRLRPLWMDDQPIWDQLSNYPLAFGAPPRPLRITLSGVTALTRRTRDALDANGIEWAASGIRRYAHSADFFHISNEVSFVADCPNLADPNLLGGSSSMCSRQSHFGLFELLDVDVVELTGNHNNDYGYDPYKASFAWFEERGMRTVGGGLTPEQARQPLMIEHDEGRVGWIACNAAGPFYALASESGAGGQRPGAANCNDRDWLQSALARLRTQVDVVIVTLQQVEYEDYVPTDAQRIQFRQLADWGADVVIGTAAHKPQIVEFYATRDARQAFIHYGLGNLYFDQPFWGNVRFFMDTLYIYQGRLLGLEIFPGIIDDNARPRLMNPEERFNFLFFMFRQQNGL